MCSDLAADRMAPEVMAMCIPPKNQPKKAVTMMRYLPAWESEGRLSWELLATGGCVERPTMRQAHAGSKSGVGVRMQRNAVAFAIERHGAKAMRPDGVDSFLHKKFPSITATTHLFPSQFAHQFWNTFSCASA